MDKAEELLAKVSAEAERREREGPKPVRFGGYIIHAMGNTVWFTPAHNSDDQNSTKQ